MNIKILKTVAIVHNAYGKVSGEEVVIDNLSALLEERGINVQRFSRSSEAIEDRKLGKISAFFSGIHNPFSRKAFGQFLREMRPDVIHIHNLYPLISPSILPECTAQGIPVMMTVHNFRLACPNGLLLPIQTRDALSDTGPPRSSKGFQGRGPPTRTGAQVGPAAKTAPSPAYRAKPRLNSKY